MTQPSYKALTLALNPSLRCTRRPACVGLLNPYEIKNVPFSGWVSHYKTAREAWQDAYTAVLAHHWEKALDL